MIKNSFYKGKNDLFEDRDIINEILKMFLLLTVNSEVVNSIFKRGLQFQDAVRRNNRDGQGKLIFKVFFFLFSMHWMVEKLIYLLTILIVVYSFTPLEALNNSLSILVLINLHSMASKIFLMEFSGYHN